MWMIMKLNADILYDNLSEKLKIQRFGSSKEALTLSRPIFYEPDKGFEADRVYVVRHDCLPAHPPKCPGILTICVGGNPDSAWLNGCHTVFLVDAPGELLGVFNMVQSVFDQYDKWEEKLYFILEHDADIDKMVQSSIDIFDNQITVVDKDLKILTVSIWGKEDDYLQELGMKSDNSIPLDIISKLQNIYSDNKGRKKPFFCDYDMLEGGLPAYTVNLFFGERYEGSVSLAERNRSLRQSDYILFRKFCEYIQEALYKRMKNIKKQVITTRSVIKDLLDCFPVDEFRIKKALEFDTLDHSDGRWLCFIVRSLKSDSSLPVEYICSSLEGMLTGCISMLYESDIVSFAPLLTDNGSSVSLLSSIEPYLSTVNLQIGISYPFDDIRKVRTYYRQAFCALETGNTINPGSKAYRFEEVALPYMLSYCLGEFTVDEILPDGLRVLKQYDVTSSAGYWKTLRIYLDNEMNATRTARELYVHRSTLLQRLSKIFELLGTRLVTPEERLYIRMFIYLIDYVEPTP